MRIKKVIETPEGDITFEGNLSEDEMKFLIEFAINYFVRKGIVPFDTQSRELATIQPEVEAVQ